MSPQISGIYLIITYITVLLTLLVMYFYMITKYLGVQKNFFTDWANHLCYTVVHLALSGSPISTADSRIFLSITMTAILVKMTRRREIKRASKAHNKMHVPRLLQPGYLQKDYL